MKGYKFIKKLNIYTKIRKANEENCIGYYIFFGIMTIYIIIQFILYLKSNF